MPTTHDPQTPTDDAVDPARRDALATLGALATWVPPTVLTLLLSPRASAASAPPPPPPF